MRRLYVFLLKNFALFSSTRGYNVILLVLSQYISALFFFSIQQRWFLELLNLKLHFIVFSSALSLSAGFLINNFYDLERDIVNKPIRTNLNNQISTNSKLILSILLNSIALFAAYFASYRIALFFLIYQFLFWFYSHKINKILFLNNLTYVLLVSFPFLVLFLLYNNFSSIILLHSGFLFLLILIADILKDYRSLHTDIIYNYETIPSRFSEFWSKSILSFLLFLALGVSVFFVFMFQTNYLIFYHYVSLLLILFLVFGLWKGKTPTTFYSLSSLLVRFYVLIGVLSIPLLKYSKFILHNFLDHLVK